ncbi:LacI family DNA-binding transcriptional regulator [Humibacter ginsenosidimutans]|nr:LacI family DNA-binding transcriptional regulator [Humibacter ginsenosidimutans]
MNESRGAVRVIDVARAAGVSTATVSNVINKPDRVGARTRRKVERAIDDLGFVPNRAAQQLRIGVSSSVGLIVPDVSYPFFTDLARGAEAEAAERGLSVFLGNSDINHGKEVGLVRSFLQQRVRGLLVAPITDPRAVLDIAEHAEVPFVLVDTPSLIDANVSSVASDGFAGGRIAVRHLRERGSTRLAFIGWDGDPAQVLERWNGAQREAQETPGMALRRIPPEGRGLPAGVNIGRAILAMPPSERPDGLIAPNDALAVGVVNALVAGAGTEVFRDIRVVGYDDLEIASNAVVPITSIRQSSELIGRSAISLLEELVSTSEPVHRRIVYEPTLVVRSTT